METNDIAGLVPQAYWNNVAAGGSGTADTLLDSDNQASPVTLEWTTSGEWGAGTGAASATQRMLNGLLQALPGAPGTIVFSGVPDGAHTIIAYTVGIPLQFQNANYSVIAQGGTNTVYTRVMNADEYNAGPGFFRGASTDPNVRPLSSYVRFDNVHADGGVITLAWDTITTGFDRGAPVNAVQLILNSPAAGVPPTIVQNPSPTLTTNGGTVVLNVQAQGDNLTYQWRKSGKNVPNGGNISGATTANLRIESVSDEEVGVYNVAVFNANGSALSKNASLRISEFKVEEDLAVYLPLNETSGTSAANSAPSGVAGVITGTPAWGAAKIANGLTLDGASYLVVSNYAKANRELSASAWVNVAAGVSSDVAIVRNAIGALGVGAGAAGQFELGLDMDDADGTVRLTAAIGAGPNLFRATAPAPLTLGSWQHVAFSADGAQLRLYINGQEVASTDYSAALNSPDIAFLSVGARLAVDTETAELLPDAAGPNFLSGGVDDLGVWNRGLSADEVSKIYAAGNQGQPLTSIVPEIPAGPGGGGGEGPDISIARNAQGDAVITFEGTLESADNVNGPYTAVAGATSPHTVSPSTGNKFYRSKE
jgi:hypothetical protein